MAAKTDKKEEPTRVEIKNIEMEETDRKKAETVII